MLLLSTEITRILLISDATMKFLSPINPQTNFPHSFLQHCVIGSLMAIIKTTTKVVEIEIVIAAGAAKNRKRRQKVDDENFKETAAVAEGCEKKK